MQSYRSEIGGGLAAGLSVLGTLNRSSLTNIASDTFLCDNESEVLSTNRPLADSIFHRLRKKRLNMIGYTLFDLVHQQANGPRSARSSTDLWDSETCALFIRGRKITRRMKERLRQQLLDGYLRSYLNWKGYWNAHHFESIDWKNYSSAFKIFSIGRQTGVAKYTHNI
jgi:hypothetical protein